MSLQEASSSTPVRRKPRNFRPDSVVSVKQSQRSIDAIIHPPLRTGPQQKIDIEAGTVGIVSGPASDGVSHLVVCEYGHERSATVAIHPDHLARA